MKLHVQLSVSEGIWKESLHWRSSSISGSGNGGNLLPHPALSLGTQACPWVSCCSYHRCALGHCRRDIAHPLSLCCSSDGEAYAFHLMLFQCWCIQRVEETGSLLYFVRRTCVRPLVFEWYLNFRTHMFFFSISIPHPSAFREEPFLLPAGYVQALIQG